MSPIRTKVLWGANLAYQYHHQVVESEDQMQIKQLTYRA